ncbi:MAG TPA: gliding motility lipoprotein GldD [Flavobacterium sp.]|nr:gliding motility lipoprotein GldD [Flavobacterium sp.]HPJ09279.1 gliding motility lipoprotein GldD [Flavobacterium sp.]
MLNKIVSITCLAIMMCAVFGCKKETLPKPSSQLTLEYPLAEYAHFENHCPFTFDMNSEAIITEKSDCNFEINYPKMKATIYVSYKPVSGNIKTLLRDAQKLTYEHVIKADDILEQPFINNEHKVYGMFYQVNGNAATNGQFYATDSLRHFIDCSVYFYAKPNFDSVMPAASYVKNDMQQLMESLRWK